MWTVCSTGAPPSFCHEVGKQLREGRSETICVPAVDTGRFDLRTPSSPSKARAPASADDGLVGYAGIGLVERRPGLVDRVCDRTAAGQLLGALEQSCAIVAWALAGGSAARVRRTAAAVRAFLDARTGKMIPGDAGPFRSEVTLT